MALQYQSFPDAAGDSDSLAKLIALRLPDVRGLRMLDVGCNEGFFCGYAAFAGAASVLGIDASAEFIQRARQRFPSAQFLQQSWDQLPPGEFDLILLASALHYASDQAALLQALLQRLSPSGVLVLELGIAAGDETAWVEVDRGFDRPRFPTWGMLAQLLPGCVWKMLNHSVPQAGDPVPRYVLHVRRRLPFACLLLQLPGSGKTTLSQQLFAASAFYRIENDQCLLRIAAGEYEVGAQLRALVQNGFQPQALDAALRRVIEAGALPQLVDLWLRLAQGRDFVLDGYIPAMAQSALLQQIKHAGYCPVLLQADLPGPGLTQVHEAQVMAQEWLNHLRQHSSQQTAPLLQQPLPFQGTRGHWDSMSLENGKLKLSGWAVHESGRMPALLQLCIGEQQQLFERFERRARPDVQQVFGLPHGMLGWVVFADVPPGLTRDQLLPLISLYGGDDPASLSGPFGITPRVGVLNV